MIQGMSCSVTEYESSMSCVTCLFSVGFRSFFKFMRVCIYNHICIIYVGPCVWSALGDTLLISSVDYEDRRNEVSGSVPV